MEKYISIKTLGKQSMQTNKQVLRAMVESEEVSLQATAEAREGFCCSKCDREIIPQFGGRRGNGLELSEGVYQVLKVWGCHTFGCFESQWQSYVLCASSNQEPV